MLLDYSGRGAYATTTIVYVKTSLCCATALGVLSYQD